MNLEELQRWVETLTKAVSNHLVAGSRLENEVAGLKAELRLEKERMELALEMHECPYRMKIKS